MQTSRVEITLHILVSSKSTFDYRGKKKILLSLSCSEQPACPPTCKVQVYNRHILANANE